MGEETSSLEFGENKNLAQIDMKSKPLGETETALNIAHLYYCLACRLCSAARQHVQLFKGFGFGSASLLLSALSASLDA